MKSSISQKLICATISVLFLVLAVSVGSILSVLQVEKAADKILKISSFTRMVQDLRLYFEKVLMPPHDYLIYGDPNEIKIFEEKLYDLKRHLVFVNKEIKLSKDGHLDEIRLPLNITRDGIEKIDTLAKEIFSISDPLGQGAGSLMKEMDINTEYAKKDIKELIMILSKNKNFNGYRQVYEFLIFFQNILMPPHDYLILGQSEERRFFDKIHKDLNKMIEDFLLLSDSEQEKALIIRVKKDFEKVSELGRKILEIDDPLNLEGTKKMKLMDAISNQVIIELDTLLEYFKAEAESAKRSADKTKKATILFTVVMSLILVLGGIIGGILFSSTITDPVRQLLQATQKISAGDLTHKAEVKTNDEIGELAKSFNKMTEDLRRYQDQLIHAKEYIDNIIKSMIDTLIVVNPDGRIHTINQATLKLLNYAREEDLVGKPIENIFIKDADLFKGAKMKELIEGGPIRNYDTVYTTSDGTEIPINLSASVMRDKEGNLLGTVCVARDMREIKKLISNLRRTYKNLQSTQAQLIQSSRLASMGVLAAGVAHEINNPMNIIINYAGLLEDELEPKTEHVNYVKGILKEGERIVRIVKNLLQFARAEKQEHSLCCITDVIDASIEFMDAYLAKDAIRIEKKYSLDLPMINGKPSQLEQVFINLILNARDALNEKYPKPDPDKLIRIEVSPVVKKGNKYIRILFIDHGCGISQEHIDKIFDPFFSTKRVGKGTGLGLSITYGIITEHKGSIEAYSQESKETMFVIDLPSVDG